MLCYHAVSDRWPSPLAVRPEQLERQLALLVRRGYRGTTFEGAVSVPPAPRTLAVTFDDGYRSVLEHALPVLDRLESSRAACEEHLGACRSLALPYGDGDARVLPAARAAGYVAVAGLPGEAGPAPPGWPRVGVYRGDGTLRFRAKVSPLVRRSRRRASAGS